MLETQNGSISLKELENLLEHRLSVNSIGIVPQKISCLVKEGNVMILLHYQQPAMPYPRKVFAVVKNSLDELLISSEYQILTYLVVQGKYQSSWQPHLPKLASTSVPLLPSSTAPESVIKEPIKLKLPKLLLAGIGIVTAMGLGYLANRHCLFNNCALIPQANQLARQAELIIEHTPEDLAIADQQLVQAQQLLNKIPSWSPHYREADNLAQSYQKRAQNLENFQQALTLREQALSLSDLPLTIPKCEEIESLWIEAIALMESIDSTDKLYELAQEKLPQFNLEKQAITSLKTAQEAAQLGKVRESVARSLENWQLVEATWRTALERLAQISPDSQIANQATIEQLSSIYQSRLDQAMETREQEALAFQLYEQGQAKAKLAQTQAENKQWQASVYHWREALQTLQQIPSPSFVFPEAENLVNQYQNSLQQAETKLSVALNLERICTADIKICNYNIDNNLIKIVLTPVYQQQLWQVSLAANSQSNAPAQMELRQHLSGLDSLFQNISNNTGVPVEVYDSQQVLIVSYLPL